MIPFALIGQLFAGLLLAISTFAVLSRWINDGVLLKAGFIALGLGSLGNIINPNYRAECVMVAAAATIVILYLIRSAQGHHLWTPPSRKEPPNGNLRKRHRAY